MHDKDNQYKAAAGGLMKAAQDLAATKDFASAREAVVAVKKAAAVQSPPAAKMKWEKVASLPETMKKVPLINTKLKGCLRRIERRAEDARGHAAVLAVIAHGSMANAGDTEKPDEVQKWCQYCVEMRDASAAVNAAIRALDKEAITAAMTKLQKSCDDCHEVFQPEQLGKTETEGEPIRKPLTPGPSPRKRGEGRRFLDRHFTPCQRREPVRGVSSLRSVLPSSNANEQA
jgi:hypothetical protein